ncbi:N-acetylmuramoyl-L-alanine amidase [Streptomyces capillispiralis]|uniref:N-acetylmuramoyl-L-alanine amidase n=1 Tax=Streptomyces capillispiralis TaxID=68182 RepID=UPI00142EE85D|nr:N-acetylmuramoyl-L-alanine amidase [Streptomyces capillispiralis]GHH96404.1 hypothetical protein GCM10017779_68610 [Streptomyces capillispiralis]
MRSPGTGSPSASGPPRPRETQRSPFPISAVGLTWTGPGEGLQIRFLGTSVPPTPWMRVKPGCPCGRDERRPVRRRAVSRALVRAPGAEAYQLAYPESIDLLSGVIVDTVHGSTPTPGASPTPTASPTPLPSTPEKVPDLADLPVVRRSQWGAVPSLTTASRAFAPVQAVTVHHTVTADDDPDPAGTVRAIFQLHAVHNGWGDIGYHFLVDAAGRVYEGRDSGDPGTIAHNASGDCVTAFHTADFNTGNIGIALLGDMTVREPTAAARRSVTTLVASLSRMHGLDPRAPLSYRNPLTGRTLRLGSPVNAHGAWTPTECPGTLTPVEDVRAAAAKALRA